MPVRETGTPTTLLYRIGRGDPAAWPPWDRIGDGRFDDPEGDRYRVLYAGERRACFAETLARFRPPPALLLDPERLPTDVAKAFGRVPPRWLATRRIASFRLEDLDPPARWLDVRAPETHQVLRRELASVLVGLAFTDFDISTATSSERRLTQPIGAWAYDRGYQGIVYSSRIDPNLTCIAIFERDPGVRPTAVARRPLGLDDPDLRAVAEMFGLRLPPP
jgi:hypothetical protein